MIEEVLRENYIKTGSRSDSQKLQVAELVTIY